MKVEQVEMEVLSQDWPIGLLMDVTASTARPGRVAVAGRHRWFNSPLSPTLFVKKKKNINPSVYRPSNLKKNIKK